ncbi:MAG: delta-60 repeat domain-containing protein [Desulfobulbaceae bacterium]
MKTILSGVFLLTLLAFGSAGAAGIGELDATFGQDGRVATPLNHFGDQAYALAVQPDGRILAAGSSSSSANLDFAVVRYTREGKLDPTFNLDGIVTTMVGRDDDEIAAIAVQDDGYIVVAGYTLGESGRDFALARYTPDGVLDHSFGLGGIVVTEYGGLDDELTALAVDSEGRLLAAGYTTGTAGRAVIIARYLTGGSLDPSFGDQGVSLIGVGEDALARGIAVDEEGRILIAGSFLYLDRTEVMVLRLTPQGELDESFGGEGLAVPLATDLPTDSFGISLLDSGAILVAGAVGSPGTLDTAVFKFTTDGEPDLSFGQRGILVTEASAEDDVALAVASRASNVYLSGYTTVNGAREFLFIYHELDEAAQRSVSFALKSKSGTTGLRIGERQEIASYREYEEGAVSSFPLQTIVNSTPFNGNDDISYAVAVQDDGRAVVAGLTEQGGITSFALARYAAASAAAESVGVSWIVTKEPTEINRTGAFTGGVISDSGLSISQRGVVYSIAPDPVFKEGSDNPDPTDPTDPTDTTPPTVSGGSPTGTINFTTSTTLMVTTNETATCKYGTVANTAYDSIANTFTTTGGTAHSQTITVQGGQSYTYYVRCTDSKGNKNTSDYEINFTVSASSSIHLYRAERYAGAIGGLLVGTAHAQTDITNTSLTDTTDTTATNTSTSGVFDLSTPEYSLEGYTSDGAGSGAYSSILKKLKPSTFYYVRAYAKTSDGTVYYGNQLGFKTADACFIATAAYGSLFHPYVNLLREFRDQYLQTSLPGRLFVKYYYRHSPPVADFISTHPVLRPVVRTALLPAVGLSWLLLHLGAPGLLLLGGVAGMVGWQTRRFSRLESQL